MTMPHTGRITLLLAASLLAGCALTPAAPARQIYDLGPTQRASVPASTVAWRIADVTASPSVASEGIAYRLAFQQAQRLEHYRDSQWAAAPADLLTQRLRENLTTPAGCRPAAPGLLAVHLDAFEQVFSQPGQSQVLLRVHATLWPANPALAAQQQHWRLERPAPSADAGGAVRALSQAVDNWLPQIADWAAAAACR